MSDEPATAAPGPGGAAPVAPEPPGVSRRIQLLAGVVFLALVVTVFVVILTGGKDLKQGIGADPSGDVVGVPETAALLKGVPQDGLVLGQADAPVTIVEFLDLQCPFCAMYENVEQPQIIDAVVRTGQAKIQAVPLAILGPDSDKARTVLLGLAERDRAWNFLNLMFLNQGNEGSGYVTPDYLRRLVAEVPGTSAADAAPSTTPAIAAARKAAMDLGKAVLSHPGDGTPYVVVGPTGGDPKTFPKVDLNATQHPGDQVIAAVRAQLRRASDKP